jgi:hypothetical protein
MVTLEPKRSLFHHKFTYRGIDLDKMLDLHAWHFRTRNCTNFPNPRDNFGSLVANLRIVKLLKLRELFLVRVFLEGYLEVIGRQMVSHGSK